MSDTARKKAEEILDEADVDFGEKRALLHKLIRVLIAEKDAEIELREAEFAHVYDQLKSKDAEIERLKEWCDRHHAIRTRASVPQVDTTDVAKRVPGATLIAPGLYVVDKSTSVFAPASAREGEKSQP